ncbi:MAG: glycosyltransferase [Gemmatimonadaceae bacterium]
MSTAPTPDLSIVVVAFVGEEYLRRLLDALLLQVDDATEVLVACDALIDDIARFRERYPDVEFVRFEGRLAPASLRATGVARAKGRIVALVEDHCVPAPEWKQQVLAAHEADVAAVGGAIEKGFPPDRHGDTALNWALYLADYSRYALPMAEGRSGAASDCNVSYKRQTLADIEPVWSREFHENLVHAELEKGGGTLWFSPRIVVHEQRSMTWSQTLSDRYSFGRLFGSTRVVDASPVRRLTMSAAALLLPPLLVARVANNVFRRRRYFGPLVRATVPLIVVASAWALGELVGYVTGSAGASLSDGHVSDTRTSN